MEDDLKKKMEDNPKKNNGKQPNFFIKWKTT